MNKLARRIIAILLVTLIVLSDLAVPVTYAVQHTEISKPLVKLLPEPKTSPLQKAIAGLTTEAEVSPEVLGLADESEAIPSAWKKTPIKIAALINDDFKADEEVIINVSNFDNEDLTTTVINNEGETEDVEVHEVTKGTVTELQIEATDQFTPGKFTIEVKDESGNAVRQDFTWGVLAINPDKSLYTPKETAKLSFAVLDNAGEMVCNAQVALTIKTPDGKQDSLATDDGGIKVNPVCHSKEFTLTPDYEAVYELGGPGDYNLILSAKTPNGTHRIEDKITVTESVPFDIKRSSATRIYPPLVYPMNLEITANQDFTGTIAETVPESFTITPSSEANSYDKMNTLYLDSLKDPAKRLQQQVQGAATSLVMPFDGAFQITQGFGTELTESTLRNFYAHYGLGGHDGIDFALPMGTPLYAVDSGNVLIAGNGDYGTTIIIEHAWGRSYYGHLSKTTVEKMTTVTKGSLIGYSGNTGESTGPHLHFGMKPTTPDVNNGYAGKIDPLPYLPIDGAATAQVFNLTNLQGVLAASDSAEHTPATPTPKPESISTPEAESLEEPVVPEVTPEPSPEPEVTETTPEQEVAGTSDPKPPVMDYTVHDDTIREEVAYSTNPRIEKVKVIKWQVSLKKGEKTTLSYAYKTPLVSPQFYTVGPVKFFQTADITQANKPTAEVTTVFEEERAWQIAADAVGVDWYNKAWQYRKAITLDATKVTSIEATTPWCNDNSGITCTTAWGARKKITFNNSASATNLTSFPVLINLDSGDIDRAKTQADGDDLRFVDPDDNTVVLSHEIENYDEVGTDQVWVEVPQINAGSTTDFIWMYYDNASATSGQDVSGTWNSAYRTVWHLKENTNYADSTSNNNDATGRGGIPGQVTGQIGTGQDFNGTSDWVEGSVSGLISGANAFTVEMWIEPDACSDDVLWKAFDGTSMEYVLCRTNNGDLSYWHGASTNTADSGGGEVSIGTSQWQHVAMVHNGSGTIQMYVNGVAVPMSDSSVTDQSTTGIMVLSTNSVNTPGEFYDGGMDEVRVSNTNRSTDWMEATYSSGNDTMNTFGPEEIQGGGASPDSWCSDGTGVTCNTNWSVRKKITIDNSTSSENLVDFPLLVKLDAADIDRAKTQSGGQDLRFVDGDNNTVALNHEIEEYNETGSDFVWVKVPQIDAASNTDYIWMYYGNASASAPATELGNATHATGVWDSSYTIVHHLNESASPYQDATSNNRDGSSATAPTATTGRVAGAQDFSASSQRYTVASPSMPTTNFTFTAVFRGDTSSLDYLMSLNDSVGAEDELSINYDGNTFDVSTNGSFRFSSGSFSTGTTNTVTLRRSSTSLTIYINGASSNSGTDSTAFNFGSCQLVLGAEMSNTNCASPTFTNFIDGMIDEMRVSNIARSAEWIEAEHRTSTDAMNSFSPEEEQSLTNFPVLVSLSSDANLQTLAQTDGDDILFTDSTGRTKLPHQIDSYTSGTGALTAWIKIPSLSRTSNTEIYMYYGNPVIASQQDATNVWDSNYTTVLHLNETATINYDLQDSTTTNNDHRGGGGVASNVPTRITGIINFAQDFDGTSDRTDGLQSGIISGLAAYTVETWINKDTCTATDETIFKQFGAASIEFATCYSNNYDLAVWLASGNEAVSAGNVFSPGTWTHVALVHDGNGTIHMYVNGAPVSMTDSSVTPTASVGTNVLSTTATSTPGNWFDGGMDELRTSTTNRSATWLGTQYNNQNSPSTFHAVGSQETYPFAPTNAELMRHGKFFDGTASEQPFAF